jgi:hypothetical protein
MAGIGFNPIQYNQGPPPQPFAPGQLWGKAVPVLPPGPPLVFRANTVNRGLLPAKKGTGTRKNRTNLRKNFSLRNRIKRAFTTMRYRETAANRAEREVKEMKKRMERKKEIEERDRKRAEVAAAAAKRAEEEAEAAARAAEEARVAEAARVADETRRREAAQAELNRLREEEAATARLATEARSKAKREALLIKYKEEIQTHDAEIEVYKDEISRANDAIRRSEKDIDSLDKRLAKERNEKTTAQEAAATKKESLEKLRLFSSVLSSTMKENAKSMFEKNAIRNTMAKKADVEKSIGKLENEVKAAYERVDAASTKIRGTEEDLLAKREYIEAAKKYIGEREERIQTLNGLIDELKAGRFNMKNSNSD